MVFPNLLAMVEKLFSPCIFTGNPTILIQAILSNQMFFSPCSLPTSDSLSICCYFSTNFLAISDPMKRSSCYFSTNFLAVSDPMKRSIMFRPPRYLISKTPPSSLISGSCWRCIRWLYDIASPISLVLQIQLNVLWSCCSLIGSMEFGVEVGVLFGDHFLPFDGGKMNERKLKWHLKNKKYFPYIPYDLIWVHTA